MLEPNGWYYFNKAQQAIWAGDIEKARSFLRQAKSIFMVEKEKYDISIHKSKNEKVHIEWNEISKKAKTNIQFFNHVEAAIHACTFLLEKIGDAGEGLFKVKKDTDGAEVFLSARIRDEMSVIIRGYAPKNKFPFYDMVFTRLNDIFKRSKYINSFEVNQGNNEINFIIHTADYIGEAFIVFEPWFLVRGSMMCGSWNPYKLEESTNDLLDMLNYILTEK